MQPKKILIREVGPREGVQILKDVIPTDKKLQLIEALKESGVKEIEVTSFVRPDKVPQMADAELLVKSLKRQSGVKFKGLYLNRKGFERAIQFDSLVTEAWLYTSACEIFLKKNSNLTHNEFYDALPLWEELFASHKKELAGVMVSTAFGSHEQGLFGAEITFEHIRSTLKRLTTFPKEIALADTVGLASPITTKELVSKLQSEFPEISISLHLHDTRGLAIANVYEALQLGVAIFESSIGGLGGCPFTPGAAGNVATEELLYLCERLGISTGIDLKAYLEAFRLAEDIVGKKLPSKFGYARKLS